jgi:hypothetical protein
MDEYKISKLIKKSVELMKMGELSEFIVKDFTLFKYGFDYEILKNLGIFEKKPEFLK